MRTRSSFHCLLVLASIALASSCASCDDREAKSKALQDASPCTPKQTVHANGIDLEYDTFGDASAPPVLLVMGLGAQMVGWDEAFCRQLASQGFYIIRFDNRDIGLSTKLRSAGPVDLKQVFLDQKLGRPIKATYRLSDMALDAVGLLDALHIRAAHVAGVSMGGMIAQEMAIDHPEHVLSLTSIMSSTWDPNLPGPTWEVSRAFGKPPGTTREEVVQRDIEIFRILNGSEIPFDEARMRELVGQSFDRCYYPEGLGRQLVAIMASGSRKERLRKVTAPTLVMHGEADPLIPKEGGIDTANSIPGAKLVLIPGLGHNLPKAVWDRLIGGIVENAKRAGPPTASAPNP